MSELHRLRADVHYLDVVVGLAEGVEPDALVVRNHLVDPQRVRTVLEGGFGAATERQQRADQ